MFPLSGWAGAGQGGVAQLAPHMPVTARRGSLQLWQFLIAMLEVSRLEPQIDPSVKLYTMLTNPPVPYDLCVADPISR